MPNDAHLADLHTAENLLACYYREVSRRAGDGHFVPADGTSASCELRLTLADRRREIRVLVSRSSLIDGFSCRELPRLVGLEGGGGTTTLTALDLARLLLDDLAVRVRVAPHAELMTLVEDSRRVMERLLSTPRVERPGTLGAEQSLTFGHPFHPSPKARIGFDQDDVGRYSPEMGASFRLHLMAVRAELTVGESIGDVSFASCVEDALGTSLPDCDGRVLIPVHPFQARRLHEVDEHRALVDRGDIIDLGPFGSDVLATSSVRTVQREGARFALKTSLDVRVTNCIRRNAVHEMQSALQVARWMREEAPRLRSVAPRFHPLEECAFVSLLPRADLPHFGVLARDVSPTRAPSVAGEALVAASLFGDRHLGRQRLARLLPPARRAQFFSAYLDALVVPMLHLFFEVGLMFEPHLQNVLVTGFDGTAPRVLLRDFDNCKIVEGVFASHRLEGLRPEVDQELRYPFAKAFERLVYCLFVNNLAEVAAALADGDANVERSLFRQVADVVASYRDRSDSSTARRTLDALLSARTLPAKANLLTRAFKYKDRDAPFVGVSNPLRPQFGLARPLGSADTSASWDAVSI